jgi:hypothetical protein
MNTIPKSLHTVTVLVAVARLHLSLAMPTDPLAITYAVNKALETLGYADAPDAHQLADKARKILAKAVQS